MQHAPSLSLVLAFASLSALGASAAHANTTAVLPVVADDDAAPQRELVDAALRGELRRRDGVSLQAKEDTLRHLDGAGALGLDCDALEATCAAKLAALCGVDHAVTAHLQAFGDDAVLSLTLVDVSSRQLLGRTSLTLSRDDVVGDLRTATDSLYVPATVATAEPETSPADPGPKMQPMAPPSSAPLLFLGGGAALSAIGAGAGVSAAVVGLSTLGLGTAPLAAGESVDERRGAIGLAQGSTLVLWVGSVALIATGASLAFVGALAPPAM